MFEVVLMDMTCMTCQVKYDDADDRINSCYLCVDDTCDNCMFYCFGCEKFYCLECKDIHDCEKERPEHMK